MYVFIDAIHKMLPCVVSLCTFVTLLCQPLCCKCSLHLVACWNCALKTSESSPNSRWQDGVATGAHCTNTSCSQPFACILHVSVMMSAPSCSWIKAAYSTMKNYPPSTDGSSWRFSFRRCLESSQDQTCTAVCMGPGLRLLRLKRQK